jgi:hypothetical protein
MRRLCLTLLCGLVAVPAAFAAAGATGDGVFELKGANGRVVLNGTRGAVWGQMDKGTLTVTDPVYGDGTIFVSGAEKVTPGTTESVNVYIGKDIHFRVTAGKVKLAFRGTGVDFTAVGVGTVRMLGDAFADEIGKYSLDSGKWNSVPVTQWISIGFGVQPIPVPTP